MKTYQVDIDYNSVEKFIEADNEKEAVDKAIEDLKVDIELYGWKGIFEVYAEELEE